jgi:hypothetical protein
MTRERRRATRNAPPHLSKDFVFSIAFRIPRAAFARIVWGDKVDLCKMPA